MRILSPLVALAATVASAAAPIDVHHSNWVVLGTHGGVLDVDPAPFMPEARRQRKLDQERHRQEQIELARAKTAMAAMMHEPIHQVDDGFFDDDDGEQTKDEETSTPHIPDIETLYMATDLTKDAWVDSDTEPKEEVVDTSVPSSQVVDAEQNQTWSALAFLDEVNRFLEDESSFPAIQGSIVFAELSCIFVGFIGYLVYCIPLWSSFTRGHKCCLVTAFSAAVLYQFVVVGWFWGAVPPDMMLWSSSLITRMISLGMVPLTTTSFMGRARIAAVTAAAANQRLDEKPAGKASSHSRHRHSRARSN